MNPLKFFRRKPPPTKPPPPKPVVVPLVLNATMTIAEWREHSARTSWASELLRSPLGMDMIAVLRNSEPHPTMASLNEAALMGAFASGYRQCVTNLIELANPIPQPIELPEPTYDNPETYEKGIQP